MILKPNVAENEEADKKKKDNYNTVNATSSKLGKQALDLKVTAKAVDKTKPGATEEEKALIEGLKDKKPNKLIKTPMKSHKTIETTNNTTADKKALTAVKTKKVNEAEDIETKRDVKKNDIKVPKTAEKKVPEKKVEKEVDKKPVNNKNIKSEVDKKVLTNSKDTKDAKEVKGTKDKAKPVAAVVSNKKATSAKKPNVEEKQETEVVNSETVDVQTTEPKVTETQEANGNYNN